MDKENYSKKVADIFDKYADSYESKYMDVSMYHKDLETFCKAIEQSCPKILDIACGPGNISNYILLQNQEFDILGIDLSANMVKLAQKNNPNAEFRVLDYREIDSIDINFDGIVCAFLLPYLSKSASLNLISTLSEKLNHDGVLYLAFMEGMYTDSELVNSSDGNDSLHSYYHEESYILASLNNSGLRPISVNRYKNPVNPEKAKYDLVITARKN